MKNWLSKIIYIILASCARKVIERHRPFVIGVTGATGKTATKEAIFQVMNDHFVGNVGKTSDNLNTHIGIPLSILGYDKVPSFFIWPFFLIDAYFRTFRKKYPKFLVLVMGVEHSGDLIGFSKIVKPDISIITSLSSASQLSFDSLNVPQKEYLSMIDITKNDTPVFVNVDDLDLAKINHKRFVTVGIKNRNAEYHASNIIPGRDYRIETVGQKISIKAPGLNDQLVFSQLFAFAVGQYFKIQSLMIKTSLEKIEPNEGLERR